VGFETKAPRRWPVDQAISVTEPPAARRVGKGQHWPILVTWFPRLLLLFLIVPILELVLLLRIGSEIGFLATVALIVVTAVIGSYLTQREGISAWRRFRERIARGEMPGDEMLAGIVILLSGALLLTPGVITDIVGLIGLIPPSRRLIGRYLAKRMKASLTSSTRVTFFQMGGSSSHFGRPSEAPNRPVNEDDTGMIEEERFPSDRSIN
jgi:UPF0716 protein FxsA